MKNRWLMAAVVLVALSAGACRKDNKAEQLAALESAYLSGVLSKAEYEAKKQALMGSAAPAGVASAPAANPAPVQPAPAPDATPAQPPTSPPSAPPVQAPAQTPAPVTTPPQSPPPQPLPPRPQPQPATPPATEPPPGGEPEPAPLPGCVATEFRSGKGKGVQEYFYPVPVEVVKHAAAEALRLLDFTIHSDVGDQIEASRRRHLGVIVGAGGERVILRFERVRQNGQAGTLVMGETRKTFVGRMAQKSWTNAVLAQIACHLHAGR